MEKPPRNIYEEGEVNEEEKERLQALDYPNFVSESIIGENLEGKIVLDVGAGPNTELGKFVRKHGGEYLAFDISEAFLESQKRENSNAVRGNAKELPFRDSSVDIAHERFVLMHLSPEDRKKVIEELFRISKNKTIFAEYDWSVAGGSEAVNKFIEIQKSLTPKIGVDILMGGKVREEVEDCLGEDGVEAKRFQRGPGDYSKEWAMLGKTTQKLFDNLIDKDQAAEIQHVIQELDHEVGQGKPSVRPDIVTVELMRR